MNPVALFQNRSLTVMVFGKQQYPLETATLAAKTQGVSLAHMVTPPSGPDQSGFQTIARGTSDFAVIADGIVVPPRAAIGITARDCPLVVLENRDPEGQSPRVVAFHAGRPALSPATDCVGCGFSVIAPALNAVAPPGTNRMHVHAFIFVSICGPCFTHPDEAGQTLLEPFRRIHHDAIIDETTGALDLVHIIRTGLKGRGVPAQNIRHDGLCTKEDTRLSSKRRGDTSHNLVVVCRHT